VPTFIRTEKEVRVIAARRPFAPEHVAASTGKLQVALLYGPPSSRARHAVLALATEGDRLAIAGRELYWLPSAGMMDSGLDLKAVEGLLGTMTLRTKSTIELIADRHFAA
jgi:uncharacterized protein (DUF1697 family)